MHQTVKPGDAGSNPAGAGKFLCDSLITDIESKGYLSVNSDPVEDAVTRLQRHWSVLVGYPGMQIRWTGHRGYNAERS